MRAGRIAIVEGVDAAQACQTAQSYSYYACHDWYLWRSSTRSKGLLDIEKI